MGGVKNNINKLNRNSGGPQGGLRWGVAGGGVGDPGSQRHLAFSHQGGEFCKRKTTLLPPVTVSAAHQLLTTLRVQYLLWLCLPSYCLSWRLICGEEMEALSPDFFFCCSSLLLHTRSQSSRGICHSWSLRAPWDSCLPIPIAARKGSAVI